MMTVEAMVTRLNGRGQATGVLMLIDALSIRGINTGTRQVLEIDTPMNGRETVEVAGTIRIHPGRK